MAELIKMQFGMLSPLHLGHELLLNWGARSANAGPLSGAF